MKSFNLKRILDIASGVAMLILLGNSAQLEAQITIQYPKPTAAKNFACAGDTILVTATAANIDDLVLPKSNHWSGDADDAIVAQTANSITKRFYTYHPYLASNPTASQSQEFEFTIRLKDHTETKAKYNIMAQSCPPTTSADPQISVPEVNNKYNLGVISFEFSFPNETSDTGRISLTPAIEPDQPFCLYNRVRQNNLWQLRYRAIQISDANYTIHIQYNEGDSLKSKTFGPYDLKLTQSLGALKPVATSFCPGDDLEFSLDLSSNWQKVLNQTIKNDESNISSCFDWSGSPTPVTFTRRDGNKYFFSTQVAGTSTDDYHCRMSVDIAYQSTKGNNAVIDTSFTTTYDVPIEEVQFNERKGFAQHEISICQGDPLDPSLTQLTEGATVQEYRDGNGTKINTPGYYIASKSEEISAIITAPCPWTDKLKINVIDASEIYNISPAGNTLICAGDTVTFSATANSPIAWTIIVPSNTAANDSWENAPSGEIYKRAFHNDAIVTATVSACSTDYRQFRVQVVQRPSVTIDPSGFPDPKTKYGCPYTPVDWGGQGGNNPTYNLYDLRNKTDLTNTMRAYIDNTGLKGYPMRPNDSLRLIYTAGNQGTADGYTPSSLTCTASDTARIIAYPLPPIGISYDGTPYANGGTACVPRDAAFSLTASGADSYEWLDLIGQTDAGQPGRSLELTKDSLIRVRGVENVHQCFDTFALRCAVSVEKADRVTSAADCPNTDICLAADELPSTTYAWYDPDGKPLGVSTPRMCRTYQKGEDGVYTLKTQRLGCSESLPFTLTLHPAPDIKTQSNSPICVGDDLKIEYHTGLPDDETPQIEFTFNGVSKELDIKNGDFSQYWKPNAQLSDGGTYFLKVTTDNLCSATETIDFIVEEPAVVRIVLNADTACEGENGRLKAEITPAEDYYTYAWRIDGQPVSTHPDMTITWTRNDHDIHLEVQQRACMSMADKTVTIIARPILSDMPEDTDICQGSQICLSPVSDIAPQEVVWHWINSNGKLTQRPLQTVLQLCLDDADESMNGRYYVEVANLTGSKRCASVSDTMRLTVHPTPDLRIDGPTFICDGSTVTLTAVSRIADAFHWQHNGATTAAVSIDKAGQYTVTASSAYGCQNTDSKSLEARPTPYFSLPPDTSICRGTSFLIYGPDGMDSYHWNDGSQSKDVVAEQGGWYILTVYRNECPYSDSIYVHQSFCGQFHFPTAFTPNDNRVNDTWGAISAAKDEDMAEYDLMVFDRNGKKVFHGKRISEQWDGRYKGELCPPGVYMYSFKALEKLEGIKYQGNGTVTIVR